MRLIQTYHSDLLNGDGLREVLFFSGCPHKCPGCFNPETHNPFEGKLWTKENYEALLGELHKSHISGVTLTGGDPLSIWNQECVLELCQDLKHDVPEKTIWAYTGYTWESIMRLPEDHPRRKVLEYLDVLCDGPFVHTRKSPKKKWVGSENQRVINVKESLEKGEIVLWCE